ncbi:MAG: protein translocase subunit SecA [Fimbriimonadales bacterium]
MLNELFRRWFDTSDKEIKATEPIVAAVNALEPEMQALSMARLREKSDEFRKRLQDGETTDDLLVEAFAVCREAARRTLNMRHFDVQLMGGVVLYKGMIAEMKTGEGKTLVATLPLYLIGLEGRGAHLVTVNDYLARRDAIWMGAIYHALGLSVGVIQGQSAESDELGGSYRYVPGYEAADPRYNNLEPCTRREAYECDITYGTNHEFGFDYLRDNMAFDKSQLNQRELHYAIVDEVDSILIDEARTPHIISGVASEDVSVYGKIDSVVRRLVKDQHFTVDEKSHQVSLNDSGYERIQELLGISNLAEHPEMMHYVNAGLKAHHLFHRDVEYVVKDGEVVIVDDTTGRLMFGRRFSDGLHQAIEAKEKVPIRHESQTVAVITFQNLFRLYHKLAGMTGTAKTEEDEFRKIYGLEVVVVPTYKKMIRVDHPDVVYKTEEQKFRGIAREILRLYVKQQPVLVGTRSIEMSEKVSGRLTADKLQTLILIDRIRDKLQGDKSISKQDRNEILEVINRPLEPPTDNSQLPGQQVKKTPRELLKRSDLHDILRRFGIATDPLAPEHGEWFVKQHGLPQENIEHFDEAIRHGIPHNVLNAKFHEKEALIIAEAGRKGAVTIATNMAGRGVDILLGGSIAKQEDAQSVEQQAQEADAIAAGTFVSHRRGGKQRAAPPLPLSEQERSERAAEVVKLGGLYILGTERHESRRIDNQLRGRSGRQGDPGESRYFVSLEDRLWQVFGANMLANPLLKSWPEDEPIEVKFLSNTIRKIQERIEFHFFEYRKHVLEYDDVINVQREKIYSDRRKVLLGADMRDKVLEDLETEIDMRLDAFYDPETNEWNYDGVYRSMNELFPLVRYVPPEELEGLNREQLYEKLVATMHTAYEDRERELGPETVRMLERMIVLRAINDKWMEHLANIDQLREGIGLRGYAQQDPLIAFKKDSHELFLETLANISRMVATWAFHVQVQREPATPRQMVRLDERPAGSQAPPPEAIAARPTDGRRDRLGTPRPSAPPTSGDKVGRNDPCPCGSGKKYKFCCMRKTV